MPPNSRGKPSGPLSNFYSKSTPNLPILQPLHAEETIPSHQEPHSAHAANHPHHSPSSVDSPSEAASIEDLSLDASNPSLDSTPPSPTSSSSSSSFNKDDDNNNNNNNNDISSTTVAKSDNQDADNAPIRSLPNRPITLHNHSRSHTYLGPSAFAPPFYNRPPTPLPPSPSLTSLLRPSFSAHPSRPNTPDPSSDEATTNSTRLATGTQTPNSAAASTLTTSFRTARPIPRASPKVPTYEYYGFTLYLTSSLGFLIYLLWSFLPSPFLHQLGIYYYPNRWWSLAIPAWLVVCVVYIFVALASYNTGYLTLGMGDVEGLVDEAGAVASVDSRGRILGRAFGGIEREGKERLRDRERDNGVKRRRREDRTEDEVEKDGELDWRTLWNEGTDAVMDVPIGGVCEVLYGSGRDEIQPE